MALITAVGPGCGSKKQDEANSSAVAEINGAINDGAFGTTETLDRGDGKGLNIGGSKNILTVKAAAGTVGGRRRRQQDHPDKVDTEPTSPGSAEQHRHLPRRRAEHSGHGHRQQHHQGLGSVAHPSLPNREHLRSHCEREGAAWLGWPHPTGRRRQGSGRGRVVGRLHPDW